MGEEWELARRLRDAREAILRTWEARARSTIPPARDADRLLLRDGLPEIIEDLANEASAAGSPVGSGSAPSHARQRATSTGFSIEQVIAEYEILRDVALERVETPEAPTALRERDRFHAAILRQIRAAVAEFVKFRDREAEVARAALRSANGSLEQKVQERTAALTATGARLRGLIEAVKDYAIFTLDPGGVVTSWNPGAERMKGYTADEIIGQHFSILYPEEGRRRDEPMAHLRVAAAEGRFRGEGMRVRKNGDHFLADVSISPIYEGDALTGFTKVVQDLTERNLLMQERDLLRSDADQLRSEGEYRKRFVATVTHDLRSPLSAAGMAARLIARTVDDPDKVRQWAQRIIDSVRRADRMIGDLLDASRLDAGERLTLPFDRCDLGAIARELCEELSTRHGDRFPVRCHGDTEGFWNADGLWRVLENLLTNAVKYGEPAAPITTEIRRIDGRVLLTVHNHGTIIPVADQAKLFQPYHRTDLAEASRAPGWGLGLTLVRGIVEAHRGQVKVESYPSTGTVFTVDLPVDPRILDESQPTETS